MAKLELVKEKVSKIVVEEKVTKYRLDLSKEEFYALYTVLRRIGGDIYSSPRKYIDSIWRNFEADLLDDRFDKLIDTKISSSLYFSEGSLKQFHNIIGAAK